MPEWEVTVLLTRRAKFRVRAPAPDEAQVMVRVNSDDIRSMEDLYDPAGLEVSEIISVQAVTSDE